MHNVTQLRPLLAVEAVYSAVRSKIGSLVGALVPPARPALEHRTRKLLEQYDRRIRRMNALAENHERVIASLSEDITCLDHEISELEMYSDGLRRLLGDL